LAEPNDGWPGDVLRATGVSRSFAGVHALRDVTLELRRHEVLGLIGPNGAGKTTLVNVLSGFDVPSPGTVELEGATSPRGARTAGAGAVWRGPSSTAGRSRR